MLDHEPPGDRICDKLNEENCDDTRVVSSPSLIEDTAPSNNTHFFEGVEKNLEVWFTSSNGDVDDSDLRLIPRYLLLERTFDTCVLLLLVFSESWQPSYCRLLTQLETKTVSSPVS